MQFNRTFIVFLLFFGFAISTSAQTWNQEVYREDLARYFEAFDVTGSFLLLEEQNHRTFVYNPTALDSQYLPASTFKIANALIGLETGVIPDETFMQKWDNVVRQNPSWNKDQDLETAFRNSTVWYFQEIAKKTGPKRMKHWLDTLKYGNKDISGGIDRFWLTGGLRITPRQQVDFLVRLFNFKLPASRRNMEIVKKIMTMEQSPDYTLFSKTGWTVQDGRDIGWYIGCLTTNGKNYFFACCIQSKGPARADFARARVDIVRNLFVELGITR